MPSIAEFKQPTMTGKEQKNAKKTVDLIKNFEKNYH